MMDAREARSRTYNKNLKVFNNIISEINDLIHASCGKGLSGVEYKGDKKDDFWDMVQTLKYYYSELDYVFHYTTIFGGDEPEKYLISVEW